jgi:hypothetical protein
MNGLESRRNFAAFLSRLASHSVSDDEWPNPVVTHYSDKELDGIRRDLVRLSIQRNPTGTAGAWQAEDRQQMLRLAERLERPARGDQA